MAKREKRPSRLAWFALDVDSFLEDPRMLHLSAKEKGQWALLLIKSFRNKGIVITDPEIISEQLGIKHQESKALLAKLMVTTDLLKPTGEVYEAASDRMRNEWQRAQEAYNIKSKAGKTSGEKNGTANLHLVK
jgi:hypothetical protein